MADRIERKLQEVPYADKIRSYSKPGETLITFQLGDRSPAAEIQQLWYQVRKTGGDTRHTLPPEAVGPFFNDESGDVYGSIYAFTADGFTLSELRDYVERARQEVLRLPNVAKAELIGVQEDRIYVELSSKRLGALGIDPQLIGQALAAQNAVASPGNVETAERSVALRVSGQLDSVRAVSDLPLRAAGQSFRLGDIARVERGYVDPPVMTMRFRGRPSLGLAVSMTRNGDVLRLGEDLRPTMARVRAEFPVGAEFEQVSDPLDLLRGHDRQVERDVEAPERVRAGVLPMRIGARFCEAK